MRESFGRLRDYLDTHGAASSDGMSSFLVSPSPLKSWSITVVKLQQVNPFRLEADLERNYIDIDVWCIKLAKIHKSINMCRPSC